MRRARAKGVPGKQRRLAPPDGNLDMYVRIYVIPCFQYFNCNVKTNLQFRSSFFFFLIIQKALRQTQAGSVLYYRNKIQNLQTKWVMNQSSSQSW